jgi:hypothetical protein
MKQPVKYHARKIISAMFHSDSENREVEPLTVPVCWVIIILAFADPIGDSAHIIFITEGGRRRGGNNG